MKRVLCSVLALVMVLSLASCGHTEPTVKDHIDELPVTADELLAGGYGVDDFKSVTLGLLFEVDATDFSGKLGGVYEEDGLMWHLVVDEITTDAEDPFYFDTYYDKANGLVYTVEDAGWTRHTIPDYDVGFHRLSDVSAIEIVESPRLEFGKSEYKVTGFTTHGIVSDLMSFLLDNVDLSGALILTTFTYDLDCCLNNMHWESDSADGRFVIDATVSKLNQTSVKLPIKADDAIDGDAEPLGIDTWMEFVPGCDEGEVLLAKEHFGVDYVREEDFMSGIPEKYRGMHEGVLYMARYYYNSYSIEGFQRMIATSKPMIAEEYQAVILVCELEGISFELLWQSGFMMENEFNNIRDRWPGNQ